MVNRQLAADPELAADLVDFVIHAEHDAGCSGAHGVGYGCKCGLRDLLARLDAVGVRVEHRARP